MNQRIIKFRAWDKKDKKMVSWETMEYWRAEDIVELFFSGNTDYILQQYTGLHDKNGKEIWEGDILKVISISIPNYIGEVKFEKGYFYVEGREESHYLHIPLRIEIIGNIWENSELLTPKK